MDVSVIFVNYKTVSLLIDAIDSLIDKTTGVIYEIIVVDNASGDNSKNLLSEKYKNKIIYIELPENIGFGRANNEGMKIAVGKHLFLLNPDTILQNNAIKILSDYLDSNEQIGVVGGNLFNEDGTPQASYSNSYPSLKSEINKFFCFTYFFRNNSFNTTDIPKFVKTVYGAAFMVKKTVIEKTGGFDSRFFMYAEEDELCYRINKFGYKIMNVPQCRITHLDGGSFEFSEDRNKRRLDGIRVFYQITYSSFYCELIKGIEYLTIISRLFFSKLIGNKEKMKLWRFNYNYRKWK